MTDVHTPEQRSYNMSRVRGVDTKPEMRVRRLLHGMGFRYRLHAAGMPGKPDLVFPAARAVVFVHGCFWHMHACSLGKPEPATNVSFWSTKRMSNVERDTRNRVALKADGWRVFEIWECETKEVRKLESRLRPVVRFLNARRAAGSVQ